MPEHNVEALLRRGSESLIERAEEAEARAEAAEARLAELEPVRSHLTPHGPDGQSAPDDDRASEPSLDDVVYIAIMRSAAPKNGQEVKVQMEAFRAAGVEPTATPHVLAVPLREATANHHEALRNLGFVAWTANDHFPVVSPSATEGKDDA